MLFSAPAASFLTSSYGIAARLWLALLLTFACLVSAGSVLAAGEVDTTFRASLVKLDSGRVYRTVVQPDGKIIVGGDFTSAGGAPRTNLARFNADGTADLGFIPPAIVATFSGSAVSDIALQSDGKVLVTGQFPRGLIRLNADGSPDTEFNNNPSLESYTNGSNVYLYPDNKILFDGLRSNPTTSLLVILNPDGSIISQRTISVSKAGLQSDGKVVVYSQGVVSRLNQDLTTDNTFTQVNLSGANSINVLPDGKILIGGSFTTVNGFPLSRLVRLNPDGSVDTSFNVGVSGPDGEVQSVKIEPGGKIVIGGAFGNINGVFRPRVARLNSDGTVDTSFAMSSAFVNVYDVGLQANGGVVVGGSIGSSVLQSNLIRVDSSGVRDSTFEGIVGAAGVVHKVVVAPDGKVIVGGVFNCANGLIRNSIARFNADGTVDAGFNHTELTFNVFNFDVMPDGKIVVAGFTPLGQPLTIRLNQDGSRDTTFPSGDVSDDVRVLPGGKVLLGHRTTTGLRRRNADGSVDTSFTTATTNGNIEKIEVQPDGRILIGGTFSTVNGAARPKIARLNADGTLDASFDPQAGANNTILDIAVQTDGKILIAGYFTGYNFAMRRGVARLNSNGSLDTTFDAGADDHVITVEVQNDDRILVGGWFTNLTGLPIKRYSGLNLDGTRDKTFLVVNGADGAVNDITRQSDGSIIMGGAFRSVNNSPAGGLVRIKNVPTAPRTPFDYDGDGKADISVFRPGPNVWYLIRSSDGVFEQSYFGTTGDIPVPADYDGDGKYDIAIFRPSSGAWWVSNSSNGAAVSAYWGTAGDKPRPSDFDGDGKADFIVFRPSNGNWYRISSVTGVQSNAVFGAQDDIALITDFDGDGRGEKTLFRPSTGEWTYESSLDNVIRVVGWGGAGDIPAPADLDGDGRTDFVVYRPATGNWYVLNSRNFSVTITNFGLADDKPVPADFDGDGKTDIAVYRPSSGIWYLLRSSEGFTGLQFGIASDIPTENSFLY